MATGTPARRAARARAALLAVALWVGTGADALHAQEAAPSPGLERAAPSGAEAPGPRAARPPVVDEGVDVGRISDLDLDAVRAIIERTGETGPQAPLERRSLSIEQALATALERNLELQIVAIDVQQSDLEIDATRSKFHPVAAVGSDATGTKRAEPDPFRQDQFTNSQQAEILLQQNVPTGGNVGVGVGYSREFKDEAVTFTSPGGPQPGQVPIGNIENTTEIAGLGIQISQPLLKGGRVFVARKDILDAEYDNTMRRAELRGRILEVTAETKAAYYRVVGALRQIEVIEQALERDAELMRASSALFDAGRVSKVDLFNAQISESNDRARLASAQAELELAQNQLRKVLGLPAEVQVDVTDTTIPFRPIAIELDDWVRRALDNRPELIRLRSRLEKIELTVDVSENAKLPSLDLSGSFAQGFDWASYNYTAGLDFEYQLGNTAADSRHRQAQLEHAKVRQEIARARRDIELEVREVEIRLRESVKRLRNLTAAVAGARQKGEIARGRFELGLASNFDITNADEELIQAESLLLEALVDYATQIATLEAKVGGSI